MSGDTILLMSQRSSGGPPPEKQVNLSSILSPRLGRGEGKIDEAYAWQAKEFLRKLIVGKSVTFKVEYSVPAIKRDFAAVYFNGENLCKTVVRAGWATVRENTKDGYSVDYDELLKLQAQAKAAKLGIWGSPNLDADVRDRRRSFDAEALFAEIKDKPLAAIVQWVRDAGSMRCYLPSKNVTVMVNVAGMQTPRLARRAPRKDATNPGAVSAAGIPGAPSATAEPELLPAEPYAAQAKHFMEVRLLNRDICVRLHAVERNDSFFGSIEHPAGDIRELMLSRGLAKCSDWSMNLLPLKRAAALRVAEKAAKEKRLCMWANYVAPVINGDKVFVGTVADIVSADTFVILVGDPAKATPGSRTTRRISLSSTRTPRLGRRGRDEAEPWAYQSKEFMRRLLIGKTVKVTVEYTRDPPKNETTGVQGPTRVYATINLMNKNKRNVAESLVGEGLATTMKHRQGDERSGEYDKLLLAESKAKESKRNMHSSKAAPIMRLNDISRNPSKAKSFLPFLSRSKNTKAIVEYVYSATRLRLFVPEHNCICNFALIGVRAPNMARAASDRGPARPSEPFAREADMLTRENILQREVEIDAEDIDKMGTILGGLYYRKNPSPRAPRVLLAQELLENGYAKMLRFSAERSSTFYELEEAEQTARAAKLNVWVNIDAEEAARAAALEEVEEEECRDVKLCHMNDANNFFLHYTLSDEGTLEKLKGQMADFAKDTTVAPMVNPAKHAFCAAPFDEGNGVEWYRGRVEEVQRDPKTGASDALILFIDYGNVERVAVSKLKTLSPELLEIKPLAHQATMAFVKVPSLDDDYGHEAAEAFDRMAWGKELVAMIHYRDSDGTDVVTLQYKDDLESTVTEGLLKLGHARLKRNYEYDDRSKKRSPALQGMFKGFEKAQAEAKKTHVGMWRYGDVGSDDEL